MNHGNDDGWDPLAWFFEDDEAEKEGLAMKKAREKITDILWWISTPEHNCVLSDGNYCEDRASIHDYLSDVLIQDGKNWSNVYDDIVDEIILLSKDCN